MHAQQCRDTHCYSMGFVCHITKRVLHTPCTDRAKFRYPRGIIERSLATIHKHLGTPFAVGLFTG